MDCAFPAVFLVFLALAVEMHYNRKENDKYCKNIKKRK